jgi:hypothetical protein
MINRNHSLSTHLLAAIAGVGISYGVMTAIADNSQEKITTLENKILDLEFLLAQQEALIAQKEQALKQARWAALDSFVKQNSNVDASTNTHSITAGENVRAEVALENTDPDIVEKLNELDKKRRALSGSSEQDSRSFAERIDGLLRADSSAENILVVTKGMVDLARNQEVLPNQALDMLYSNQKNPDLKRVAAQVLSMRGDNRLIEQQVNDMSASLRSENPAERRKALTSLGKTHHAIAADAVAPLLQDANTEVTLDALLALRTTGNQQHVHLVEALVNHPDASVSWLAKEVTAELQNLSAKARTQLTSADIEAELPALALQ